MKEDNITEEDLKHLKLVRNYFGEHDKTLFEHRAYAILDSLLRKLEMRKHVKPVMEEMKEALEEIDKPILFMHKRLKNGEQLNGQVAIELSKDDEYLKSIARKALSKYNELFKK